MGLDSLLGPRLWLGESSLTCSDSDSFVCGLPPGGVSNAEPSAAAMACSISEWRKWADRTGVALRGEAAALGILDPALLDCALISIGPTSKSSFCSSH